MDLAQNNTDETVKAEALKSVLDELSSGQDPLPGNQSDNQPLPVSISLPSATEVAVSNETPDELSQLLLKFRTIADTVLNNYELDRGQIEKTIQHLDQIVQMGPKVPRVYVEMLVSALRTKAETNANAVKLLDALAKLLSAGKGTQIFMNQRVNAPGDLAKLLETPPFPDEVR